METTPEDLEDWWFDELLSDDLMLQSPTHFTPVAVARCAARMLAPHAGMTVLDVGAGVGKFCVTAAREVGHATFVGVEFRPHLVRVATELARRQALTNVRFVLADAFDLDWSAYDAFYFFNPFAEQLFDPLFVLDRTIEFAPANFVLYVSAVQARLAQARIGTRLVTYHGFGALPPPGYKLVADEAVGSDRLELWVKTRAIEVVDELPLI